MQEELLYLQFDNLKKYKNIITHCFTTRMGGVSTGCYKSLNLGVNKKGEIRENVIENYKIIGSALNIDYTQMVLSNQIHDEQIKYVTEEDRGKGLICESDIIGFDALVTDRKRVPIVTFYADCVPVFFFDPVKVVIGLAHSGWRGTLKEIAPKTLHYMIKTFDCNPDHVQVAIGPSILSCCFEVGEEVFKYFDERFNDITDFYTEMPDNRWNIDLHRIIRTGLTDLGIKDENIFDSGICTKCRRDIFFSHRGDNGNTGVMAAIMMII